MEEQWKSIDGYEGFYEISNLGNVKSLVGWDGHNYVHRVKILTKTLSTTGYEKVELVKNGVRKSHKVHRLVAIAFIPMINGKDLINHIDGNKTNNALENLEWCTQSENMFHAHSHGLVAKKKNHKMQKSPRNKYNIDMTYLLDLLKHGLSNTEISNILKCSNGIVATRKYQFKKNGEL